MEEMVIWRRSTFFKAICTSVAAGFIVGAGVMVWAWKTHHFEVNIPLEAMRQAREAVESDMRAACANWFTDKRSRDLPKGRIVVCRAPDFLSNPLPQ